MENQELTNIKLLITIGILVTLMLAVVIVLFVVYYQRKMLLKNAELKIMEQEKQIELFKASVEAEEKQKEKIARNLHDEINPLLALLRFNISKHKIDIKKEKFNVEDFAQDQQILDNAIEGIRTTCLDLIPTFLLEYGLSKSLQQHLDNMQRLGKINAVFESKLTDTALDCFDKQEQLNIYRVCLELLNNLVKHAQCTAFKLSMQAVNEQLVIDISHNGVGVSNEEMDAFTEHSKGLGLKSLKARALILNATIQYLKLTNASSVTLSIPYPHV